MTRPDDVDLLSLWLLGALDKAETEAVRARIAEGVPSTLDALAEARRVVGTLGLGAPDAAPPAGARERLLAAAHREPSVGAAPQDPPWAGPSESGGVAQKPSRKAPGAASRRTRWLVPSLIGATFLLLAALGVRRAFEPTGVSAEDARFGALVLDPRTERWVFKDPTTGEELGLAIRDAESKRAWLSLKRLPEPAAGKTYVLWTIAQGEGRKPENRGAVVVRRDRRIDLELPENVELRDVAVLAISLEADPATPAPTDGAVKALARSPRS